MWFEGSWEEDSLQVYGGCRIICKWKEKFRESKEKGRGKGSSLLYQHDHPLRAYHPIFCDVSIFLEIIIESFKHSVVDSRKEEIEFGVRMLTLSLINFVISGISYRSNLNTNIRP